MTVASVAFIGALVLAALAVVFQVLRYVNQTLFPEIKTLTDNITQLRADHAQSQKQIALAQQQTSQNTARLNGQSVKIDTLLLSVPSVTASAIPPVIVAVPAPQSPPPAAPAAIPPATTTDATGDSIPNTPEAIAAAAQASEGPAAQSNAPASVNVTVNGTLNADQLKAAHTTLDALAAGGSGVAGSSATMTGGSPA